MNELTVRREINPANWDLIKSIAETTAIAKSEQSKIAKHLLFCFENDLPLSLAVNGGLYTVNGRVEVEGTVIRAQIRKHPDYDYVIVKLDEMECIIEIGKREKIETGPLNIRYETNTIGQVSFTIEDAKQAGLIKPDSAWSKYPTDMLLNRATSRAYKRFCPDIFMQSIYVRGEIGSDPAIVTVDADGVILPTIQEMIADKGHDIVLEAMNATDGSQQAVYEYIYGDDNE